MPLTMHERRYRIDVEPMGTRLPYALGVYFGPNRMYFRSLYPTYHAPVLISGDFNSMAAAALSRDGDEDNARDDSDDMMDADSDDIMLDEGAVTEALELDDNVVEGVGLVTEIDNLKVVASIPGSMEYQRVYQEIRAHYVKFSLVEDESARVEDVPSLIEDGSSLPDDVEDEFASPNETWNLPPYQQIQNIFDQQLQNIKQRAEHNLGQRVEISVISLPYYWQEQLKCAVLEAATQPQMMVPYNMLLPHELTARLAYNLGNTRRGTWFLVSVEYNIQNLYLTFAEISDRENPREPRSPIDGQYLLENLGENSPTRAIGRFEHYANIREAIPQFLLKHVAKNPYVGLPYSDIKGIILTGDASDDGMRAMDEILREVFADLPQCASGNIFTRLRPSHVVALGAARAVRAEMVNNNVLRDVYETVDIEN